MWREPGLTKQPSIPFVGQRRVARRFVRSNEASARADPPPRHRPGGLVGLARASSTEWADAARHARRFGGSRPSIIHRVGGRCGAPAPWLRYGRTLRLHGIAVAVRAGADP